MCEPGWAKRLTMHDLRHTLASHLLMLGRSLKEVQELLGHATIDMKRDAIRALDAIPRGTYGAHGMYK